MDPTKFALPVDKYNKATAINLFSFSRPHMRAFHLDWLGFFAAFFAWFAVNSLVIYIRVSIGLCKNGTWSATFTDPEQCVCDKACKVVLANGNIVSAVGSIVMRLIMGTWVENLGSRYSMALILMAFAIPTALLGAVTTGGEYIATRFFIGGIGSSFVICQYWTSSMFSKNVVGSANALVGGWGNLGGGVTQLVMPAIVLGLYDLHAYGPHGYDLAWRYSFLIPASLLIVMSVWILGFSDDVPNGNFKELYASGERKKQNYWVLIRTAARDPRVWALCFVYGGCFGSEVSMNQQLAPYFFDYFKMSPVNAGIAAATVGCSNLFARAIGGYVSDLVNVRYGHRGRHWVLFALMLSTALTMIGFSRMYHDNIPGAMVLITLFSIFVSACNGACYAVVPYIGDLLAALGPVSGIVGAGGNVGAALWNAIYWVDGGGRADRRILDGRAGILHEYHWIRFSALSLTERLNSPYSDQSISLVAAASWTW